jgi:hypothetical protein
MCVRLDGIGLKFRNDNIKKRVGVAPLIVNKFVETRLRWFGHVQGRHVGSVVRRVDQMEGSQITRDRGRPIRETIKKDLEIN